MDDANLLGASIGTVFCDRRENMTFRSGMNDEVFGIQIGDVHISNGDCIVIAEINYGIVTAVRALEYRLSLAILRFTEECL